MKWFQWDDGRQLSGYRKMLLATSKLLKFDCYLLKVPDGCSVPAHVDPVIDGFEHYRLNIAIVATPASSKMHVQGPAKIFFRGRAILFRPDLYRHEMEPSQFFIGESALYLLSIGWLRRGKKPAATA